jgi:hypothetical protein
MVLGDQALRPRTKSGAASQPPKRNRVIELGPYGHVWESGGAASFYSPEVVATNVAPTINTGATFRSANDPRLNKPGRARSVRCLADGPDRWRRGRRWSPPSLCCYLRTS